MDAEKANTDWSKGIVLRILKTCSDEELAELGLMRKPQVTMDFNGYTVMVRCEERHLEGLSPICYPTIGELMSKHLEEGVDFLVKPKVDDTQEFHLVRCPKCELMVEELVATPYRHVCANCAKGE